jgi:hypothetical protein
MTSSGRKEYLRSVEGRNILLALERKIKPEAGQPPRAGDERADPKLNISVVFTSVESTLTALRKAGSLASSLGARITLLVPQIVPYPLPLESPPVLLDWNERRFHVVANQSPVETTVQIYLCRDRIEALESVLAPRSIVVVGCRRRWWPSADARLAHKLRRCDYEVILTEME